MEYVTSIERIGRQEGRQEGRLEGQQEERLGILRGLMTSRFGVIDDELEDVIAALDNIPSSEVGGVLVTLSTLSRDEILARFGLNTLH